MRQPARNYIFATGSIAMSDPAARWLVYANAPGGSTYGGLDSQNTAIWNAWVAANRCGWMFG